MGPKDSVTGGHPPGQGAHSAAEAASWVPTGSVGRELAPHGIAASTLHVGLMDVADHVPAGQKIDPIWMATRALDGLRHGLAEIRADDLDRQVGQSLATPSAAA
ncbi:hypothetical protein [Streptomyces sp. NPDC005262]|uniref:hypothetical protein n=1 Tax=Streptomyces sp. NPDC005262 TaxID=3364710 RepID=UPI0036BDE40B